MTQRSILYRLMPALALTVATVGLSACDEPAGTPLDIESTEMAVQHAAHADARGGDARGGNASHGPEVAKWLADLRRATAQYQRFEVAESAGWGAELTDCMDLPGTGGMGIHMGNGALIDGQADALAPEVLVYEPQKNNRLRLVAVEYIIPYAYRPRNGPAPSLHGVDFHHNDLFGMWVLHAWVWKHNPAGMFKDWNPTVSCEHATVE